MAMYDYQCPKCASTYTRKVPVDDRDEQFCDSGFCNEKLVRKIAAPAFVVNGASAKNGYEG